MINYSKEQLLKYFTLIFLFFFPITGLNIFHSHITNLIIVILISTILILTLIFIKDSRKYFTYLIIYYLICIIYLFITYFRSKNFVSLIPNEYNLLKETLTIIKLIMPVTLLYSLKYQNISKKEYITIAKSWVIFIAGSIIISNIFKISLSSYAQQHITKNIFEWEKNIYYIYTASKGYFMYANQVSVTLLMLLIVLVYNFLTSNKKDIIYVISISIAMIMLGTRVSTLGGILTLIVLYLGYLVISLIKKIKIHKYSLLMLIPIIIWFLLIPISPYSNRNIELNLSNNKNVTTTIFEEAQEESYDNDKIKYVYDNYNADRLPKVFFENYYPIKYDSDFWYNLISETKKEDINYRFIEKNIIERMLEMDSKNTNILFGISNSRIQNVINLERDFLLHYYSYGIIGSIILLNIYITMLIINIKDFIKKFNLQSFISLSLITLFMITAFLTGNILNSLFPTIIFIVLISSINSSSEKSTN